MKGVVFTILNDMVEEKLGLDVWDAVLNEVKPESGGVYISGETYADAELFALVTSLSEMKSIPVPDLIRSFGEYCLSFFAKNYAVFFEGHDAKSFLKSVEDVIHVEVRKLYPQAGLPTFEYEDPAEDCLIMIYRSPRKLFDLAEGLIMGVADFYSTNINIAREMVDTPDNDTCRFELTFS